MYPIFLTVFYRVLLNLHLLAVLLGVYITFYIYLLYDPATTFVQFLWFFTKPLNGWLIEGPISLFIYSGIDGLNLGFLLLTCTIGLLCFIWLFNQGRKTLQIFDSILLGLMLTATFFAFLTLDFLIFFCFFELLLLPMFIFFTGATQRNRSKKAVMYFYLYTVLGSLLLLFSVLLLISQTGTASYIYLCDYFFDLPHQLFFLVMIFLGFSTKLPVYPLHIWLTEAHVEAPTVGSVLLAAIFLKLGCYGLLRFSLSFFLGMWQYLGLIFLIIALYSALSASFGALRQVDMKKIIAYASINHMGFVLAGLSSLKVYSLIGALHLMLSHGFISAGLFFCIGSIYERLHTKSLLTLMGLANYMPILVCVFFFFLQSNMSLPGTWAFVSELLIFLGLIYKGFFIVVLFKIPIYLNTLYTLILLGKISFGGYFREMRVGLLQDVSLREIFVLMALASLTFQIGIFPGFITESFFFQVKSWSTF